MRRNILRTFFAALLIFSALTVSAWAETGIVIGNGVNFREGPGTNYRVIATLERGVAVTVTNRSTPGWYAVSCGGYNGFIASSYLSISSDSSTSALPGYTAPSGGVAIYPDGYTGSSGSVSLYPGSGSTGGSVSLYPGTDGSAVSGTVPNAGSSGGESSTGVKEGYINAMYVRFRSGPSSSSSVIGEYNKGKSVQIYGYVDGWAACLIDSQPGYVYASYVTEGKYSGYSGSYWTGSSGNTGSTLPQPNGYYGSQGGAVSVVTPAPTPTPYYGYGGNVSVVPTPAPAATPYYGYGSGVTVVATPAPTAAVDASQGTLGYIVGTYVRFRSGAGTNYAILGTYNTGKAISVIRNVGNGWLYCVIDNMAGYVHGDYVLIYNQASYGSSGSTQPPTASYAPLPTLAPIATLAPIGSQTPAPVVTQTPVVTQSPVTGSGTPAYISGNNVRFRSGPSMTSALIGEFFYGNEVTFYGITDGWAMVVYNGTPGYVYAQYVQQGSSASSGAGSNSTGSVTDSSTTGSVISGNGQDVANFALQFVGYKYTWGGSSPETGFDCSGFVYYVYKQFGYTMNRVAQDQIKNGVEVDPMAIRPGDVLCFYSGSSYIGHSGIYIGDGKFVHASNSTTGVIISDLAGYYSSRGYAARRIIA